MYPDRRSESAQRYARVSKVISGGISRTVIHYRPYPLYAANGQGWRLTEVEGNQRVDCVNTMSAINVANT